MHPCVPVAASASCVCDQSGPLFPSAASFSFLSAVSVVARDDLAAFETRFCWCINPHHRCFREVGGLRNRNLAVIARLVSAHAQASKTGVSVVPLASVWLALLSLGHPVRRVPCARRDFAALLFRLLPQEILSPKKPNPKDKISRGYLPKKRRLPLGAGRLRSLRAWVSQVRFGQFRFGG